MFFGLNEGSVFSAPHNGRFEKVLSSDSADMVDGFQKLALESRLAIPIIYGVDAIHGNNSVYGATIFPHNVGLGATRLVCILFYFFLAGSLCCDLTCVFEILAVHPCHEFSN